MNAKYTLTTLLFLVGFCIASSQKFVDLDNRWFIDECNNSYDCPNYEYWFQSEIVLDSTTYLALLTFNPRPIEASWPVYGKFYREENGSVYMKLTAGSPEIKIYDFNLAIGDLFPVPGLGDVEVTAIDSVTLNSGEKRKRLTVTRTTTPRNSMYWIQGIGSVRGPMNPHLMFAQDVWSDLICYHKNEVLEYELGECETTNTADPFAPIPTISCYPNPATDRLFFAAEHNARIKYVDIYTMNGVLLKRHVAQLTEPIDIATIESGLYYVKVAFEDGSFASSKFAKINN